MTEMGVACTIVAIAFGALLWGIAWLWLTELRMWRAMTRLYLERRTGGKSLVVDEQPRAAAVSALTLPPELQEEMDQRDTDA